MTVSSTATRWAYTGDNSTVNFAYNNKIFLSADLDVYLDGVLQTETTHYTVSGAGNEGGGTVTFVTPPPTASSVIIVRDMALTQETDIPNGGILLSNALENEFDRSRIADQQINEIAGRALKYPVTDQAVKKYDAEGLVIENVADGVAANDAVNKGQMDVAVTAAAGGVLPETILQTVATLAELQTLTGMIANDRRELTAVGRAGPFRYVTSDISALVDIDPLMGHIVPPNSDLTGASGGWLRDTYGEAWVEEFGGMGDYLPVTGTGTDSTAAAQACYDFCARTGRTMRAGQGVFRVDTLDLETGWNWNGASYDGSYFSGMTIQGSGAVGSMALTGQAGLKEQPMATVFYSTVTAAGRPPFRTPIQTTGNIQYIFNIPTQTHIDKITFVANVPEFVLELGLNNQCSIGDVAVINENNTAGSGAALPNAFFSDTSRLLIRTADRDYYSVNTGIGFKYQNKIATAGIFEQSNVLIEGFRLACVVDGNGDQGATPLNGSGIDNIKLHRVNAQKCQYGVVVRTTRSNLFTLDIDGSYFERIKYSAIEVSGNLEQGSIRHCKIPLHLFSSIIGDNGGLTVDITDTAGVITGAVVNGAGNLYTPGDRVTVAGGGGNAILEVATCTGKGLAATLTIINGGTGYTTSSAQATTTNIIAKGIVIGDATDKWGQANGSGTEAETTSATTYTASGARALKISQNMMYIAANTQGVYLENGANGLTVDSNDFHATGTLNANSYGVNYNALAGSSVGVVEINNSYIGNFAGGTKTTATTDANVYISGVTGTGSVFKDGRFANLAMSNAASIAASTSSESRQMLRADATAAAVTVTLPTVAVAEGRRYVLVKTDASGNAVRFQRNASDAGSAFIYGTGSGTAAVLAFVSTRFNSMTIECIAGQWYITASNGTVSYA